MRVSKEKQDQTLQDMKQRRCEDYIFLRDITQKKLDWAIAEKKKGIEAIERYQKEIAVLEKQVLRLEGGIIIMTDLLKQEPPKPEEPKQETPNVSA